MRKGVRSVCSPASGTESLAPQNGLEVGHRYILRASSTAKGLNVGFGVRLESLC